MTEQLVDVDAVLDWYARSARDLPWRRPDASAWAVLVSEVMLQQTPVARVLPAYEAWLQRWPTPAALAAEPRGEAIRQWGRLGYPRRALRLHEAATWIVDRYDGEVPADVEQLRSLPGVGVYTASAVAAFAYGQRVAVVDTNVRRVVARAVIGEAEARPLSIRKQQWDVWRLLPDEPVRAARFSVALMELGALICTARRAACEHCPLAATCTWRELGYPAYEGPRRATQRYEGTDRYVRGLILTALREADEPLPEPVLAAIGSDPAQTERALASLLTDGLVTRTHGGTYALP